MITLLSIFVVFVLLVLGFVVVLMVLTFVVVLLVGAFLALVADFFAADFVAIAIFPPLKLEYTSSIAYTVFMGLHLKQDMENRSELQQRLNAELRAKMAARSKQEDHEVLNDTTFENFTKGTKTTTSLAPVWAMIFIALFVVLGLVVYFGRS